MFHNAALEVEAPIGGCLFSKQGHQSGPSLCVIGRKADMEKVAARMGNIPSLAYMRGAISIYGVGEFDAVPLPVADEVVTFFEPVETYTTSGAPSATLYWQVLGHAAELGIIAGRGVPARPTRVAY